MNLRDRYLAFIAERETAWALSMAAWPDASVASITSERPLT